MINSKAKSCLLSASVIGAAMFAATAPALAGGHSNEKLTIYFTRHGEKQTVLEQVGATGDANEYTTGTNNEDFMVIGVTNLENSKAKRYDAACGDSKCAEELSDRGELYAELLADWFEDKKITDDIDAVYATHKTRTQQTVAPTAERVAKLGGVVIQLPATNVNGTPATELNPQSTGPTECATLEAIAAAQMDVSMDTVVVAGHSGTLYDIMGAGNDDCAGLGLDISDEARFPKDEDNKVANFGDLWKVEVRYGKPAKFKWRKSLKPAKLTAVETVK